MNNRLAEVITEIDRRIREAKCTVALIASDGEWSDEGAQAAGTLAALRDLRLWLVGGR